MTILVWFRNDLRIRDNETLVKAVEDADEVIPFYCFDDFWYRDLESGFPKTGSFRAQFIRESVENLRKNLREIGGDLIVRKGDTATEIQKIHQGYKIDKIYCDEEVTSQEKNILKNVKKLDIPVSQFWTSALFHKNDLPFPIEKMPWVYTDFRKKMEKESEVRAEITTPEKIQISSEMESGEIPSLQDLGLEQPEKDKRAALDFKGGEDAAWQRLDNYFWKQNLLKKYKETRNGMVGADYSSKFSAWLARGCISPKSIYHQIKKYEKEITKNDSTYWLISELIWRDFFRFTALKEGNDFFKIEKGKVPKTGANFDIWKSGETGQDFVDANMKEIAATGFMSNRGRQNVASYLVNDLNEQWHAGAQWFESQLIDYDVCSNYGNWAYVAGAGHDPRKDRYFHVEKQAERYDPDGEFRALWIW